MKYILTAFILILATLTYGQKTFKVGATAFNMNKCDTATLQLSDSTDESQKANYLMIGPWVTSFRESYITVTIPCKSCDWYFYFNEKKYILKKVTY